MSGQQKRLRAEIEREMSPWEVAKKHKEDYNEIFWDDDEVIPYERLLYSVPFDVLRVC